MPEIVPMHFLLLAAGEVLKADKIVTPLKIQNFITQDEAFGVRVPLEDCRMALELLANCSFIKEISPEVYMRNC